MGKEEKSSLDQRGKQIFAAVGLVTGVVIIIAIAALILGSLLDSSVFNPVVSTGTVNNETLTGLDNVTANNFGILSTFPTGTVCTLGDVLNATGGESIASGNFTQPTTCQLILTDAGQVSAYNTTDFNITYTFVNTDTSSQIVNISILSNGFSAFAVGIVGFLGIIGVIIGIVWLLSYLKPLFSKEQGIGGFASN